jgi:Cation/multidrug efflux pump
MALALGVSWLLTWIVVPILARLLLGTRHAVEKPPGRIGRATATGYRRALDFSLRRPWLALLGLLPLLVLGTLAWTQVGSGFMPRMDEGGFILDYYSAPGTSLDETNRLLDKVGAILRHDPAVDTYSRRTGTQLGGGLTEANQGDFFVRLKTGSRPPIWTVMRRVRREIAERIPGLHIATSQLMEDLIGDLTAVPQPIEVKLYGDHTGQLNTAAATVQKRLAGLPGITEVRSGVVPAGDALEVRVDPLRAAALGLTPRAVMSQVHDAVNGSVVARLPEPPQMIGVRVWLPAADRGRVGQIRRLPIALQGGHTVPLSQVASVTPVAGQNQIVRENLKRMVPVTARTTGISLGAAATEVKTMLARPGVLPAGVNARLGGLYHQQQIAFRGLLITLVAAVALVFALLLYLYERLSAALAIIAMPLAAMAAVFIGLWITGVELNISALMGMTMIVGIVTEIAIFYFSELDMLRAENPDLPQHLALAEAGRHRLRPILMSASAAILTLLPLALAIGSGAQMQQPLAIAIIAGLLAGAPLVLLVMPALYLLLDRAPRPS